MLIAIDALLLSILTVRKFTVEPWCHNAAGESRLELQNINSREEEIVSGYKLPDDFEIVYAFSQNGQGQLALNKMMI